MEYVRAKWPHFVVAVRQVFAEMLSKHDVPENEKTAIYDALVADAPGAHSAIAEAPLQLAPNTEPYEGDRKQHFTTAETWGKGPGNLRARMLRTASRLIH